MKEIIFIICLALMLLSCGYQQVRSEKPQESQQLNTDSTTRAEAVFAGGCFWCTESDFEKLDGVIDAVSGYTGGSRINPTYKEVAAGRTAHLEAVKVIYDPDRIAYRQLLDRFWKSIDPTDGGGQFVDRGPQYRSAIFYADAHQKRMAEESRDQLAAQGAFDKPLVTDILPLGPFYEAEANHQNYYRNNPLRYKFYRAGSGRDQFLKKVWARQSFQTQTPEVPPSKSSGLSPQPMVWSPEGFARPDDDTLRKQLTPLQFKVVRRDGTEMAFNNEFWDHHAQGLYVDVVSGEPLFSSTDKFESGTGWPSFTQPVNPDYIVEKVDRKLFVSRTELRSKQADSHLGHVFNDGPQPTGLRYCINSASLAFVPKDQLTTRGYGRYLSLFE